jgi:hypothetical protein
MEFFLFVHCMLSFYLICFTVVFLYCMCMIMWGHLKTIIIDFLMPKIKNGISLEKKVEQIYKESLKQYD